MAGLTLPFLFDAGVASLFGLGTKKILTKSKKKKRRLADERERKAVEAALAKRNAKDLKIETEAKARLQPNAVYSGNTTPVPISTLMSSGRAGGLG